MSLLLGALLGLGLGEGAALESPVHFLPEPQQLVIEVQGRPFATYVWDDPNIRRSYFAHLRSPQGVPVTRALPPVEGVDATDHARMHPGLWLAFGDLNGADFWRNQGTVRHGGFVEPPTTDSNGGQFAVCNEYVANGEVVCEELCRIRVEVTPLGYEMRWESTFTGPGEFSFGDQEEMGLGVRLATPLTVPKGGRIVDSEGRTNEKQIWGNMAEWCDYSGEGGGILVRPDPGNFRPCWLHVRDYGLLVANPFGRQALGRGEPSRVVVARGESLTLKFSILIHDGDAVSKVRSLSK